MSLSIFHFVVDTVIVSCFCVCTKIYISRVI